MKRVINVSYLPKSQIEQRLSFALKQIFIAFLFMTICILQKNAIVFASTSGPAISPHPLSDLSPAEIEAAVTAAKEYLKTKMDSNTKEVQSENNNTWRFPLISLKEPSKKEYLTYKEQVYSNNQNPTRPSREAFVLVWQRLPHKLYELIIRLDDTDANKTTKSIQSVRDISHSQPPLLNEEYEMVDKLVKADPRWQKAMRLRGIDNFDNVYVDTWAPGLLSETEKRTGHRLLRGLTYYKDKDQINYYNNPIEGVLATISMTTQQVVSVVDSTNLIPFSKKGEDYSAKERENNPLNNIARKTLKPIETKMPDGASFKLEGQKVSWEGFEFYYRFDPMKGLEIFDVTFTPSATVAETLANSKQAPVPVPRSVLYKGSLSEMVVPYGDADPQWVFRNAFDVGEYGLGKTAHTLELEKDVPSYATLLNATINDDNGEPLTLENVVAIYELDNGLQWKHFDSTSRIGESLRARVLVITFTTAIGNYDYGINWKFHLDGTIEVEAFLTGILLAKGSPIEKNPCTKTCHRLSAPTIITPNHQHFFNFRLDLDVDSPNANTPSEINVGALPINKKNNPLGNVFDIKRTIIENEKIAKRDLNSSTARFFKVSSDVVKNDLGHPTAYALIPGETATPYLHPTSVIRKRAPFLDHPLWFTQYKDDEQSAAGDYPNQSTGNSKISGGIKEFQKDKESLLSTDVVLWYTFGVTHIPHPEQWPIMNTHRTGFKLVPMNFFSRNPVMNY